MPRADDMCGFRVEARPVPTATNPLGVKGAGEAGTVGALPAVTSAIVDALSPARDRPDRDAGHAGDRLARDTGRGPMTLPGRAAILPGNRRNTGSGDTRTCLTSR